MSKKITASLILFILFLMSPTYAQVLTESQLFTIAQNEMNENIPSEYRSEYRLVESGAFPKTDANRYALYYFKWVRMIGNVSYVDDSFYMKIYSDGRILTKEFHYSPILPHVDTTGIINEEQIRWLIDEKRLILRKEPELQLRGTALVWEIFADCHFILDARTGESVVYGCAEGSAVELKNFDFNPLAFQLSKNGQLIGLGALVLVGGTIYYRSLSSNRKKSRTSQRRH